MDTDRGLCERIVDFGQLRLHNLKPLTMAFNLYRSGHNGRLHSAAFLDRAFGIEQGGRGFVALVESQNLKAARVLPGARAWWVAYPFGGD